MAFEEDIIMKNIYNIECIERKNYKKYIFTEEQKDLVVALYNDLGSSVDVGKLFNVGHKVITKILEERNVKRTAQKNRQYKINEHYFDVIDTPNKAYILGFLWADGCNFPKKSTISMTLEEQDKDDLERIRSEIGSERPLEFIDYSNKHDFGYTYKNQYRLLLFSAHMCQTLNTIGMVPHKSLIVKLPTLQNELIRHFIRGLFDGDGSVCRTQYKNRQSYQHTLTITSTVMLCESLVDIIKNTLDINCHIYDASNHNGITKVFNISGKHQIKKFMDWMYMDSDLKLERKYKRYIQYFYSDDQCANNTLID